MRANRRAATSQDHIDALRLVRAEGVGPITYRRLMQRYGSAAAALEALPRLASAGGRTTATAIPTESDAVKEFERTTKLGARLIFLEDPDFPPLLAMLDDAPPCLAVMGDARLLARRAIAIVGGRNASANGQRIAETLAADLAREVVVVSGLARGIDAAAHKGALQGGTTVAAIASGLDVTYPPGHEDLQRRIVEKGVVVTEAPPGTVPQARHFPRRNRIIAGLALGIVVVEAAPRSGSLITARIAQDVGREIFAVPGSPLDPRSRGSNDLLRHGAVLTETADDVLANLPMQPMASHENRFAPVLGFAEPHALPLRPDDDHADMPKVRSAVHALLGPVPTDVDDVVRRCQFSASAVMAALLELELAGRVETLPGNRVVLSPNAES